MNYGDLQATFIDTLNNRKVNATQIKDWLQLSIQRAQRLLDVPSSLKSINVTITLPGSLAVPPDCLRLVAVVYKGRTLHEREGSAVRPYTNIVGCPEFFSQVDGTLFLAPAPAIGDTIEITYSADFAALSADTDSNWLTNYASSTIIDGAMVFACRFLTTDQRGPDYENSFNQSISEMNALADRDRFRNAVISPGWDDCYW